MYLNNLSDPLFNLASYEANRTSGSSTRSRKDEEYSDANADATAVIYQIVRSDLVNDLTCTITTAVSNATTAKSISVNTKKNSSAINTYDTRSMNMNMKEGKYQWYIITNPEPVWSLIVVTVDNARKLMDLLKDRTV